jgi:hypothetical protein
MGRTQLSDQPMLSVLALVPFFRLVCTIKPAAVHSEKRLKRFGIGARGEA